MTGLRGVARLLALQSAGKLLARGFSLPFPGPVIGMLLLLLALSGEYLFDGLRIGTDSAGWVSRGFALGTAAHCIGAARAMQVNAEAGAYAGLALGLQVMLSSLLIPLVFTLF